MRNSLNLGAAAALATSAAIFLSTSVFAGPLSFLEPQQQDYRSPAFEQVMPEERTTAPDPADEVLPQNLQRTLVNYSGREAAGTIIVDTPNTYLYYVMGGGKALRYGIGVGREGFTWSGTRTVERKAEWPDWTPPPEMIARQPYLPRWMAGGPGNPLGARAIYIAGTLYRIHGTNAPDTIGKNVSSGCIRMLNADVIDLYNRVTIGSKVVVLPASGHGLVAKAHVPITPVAALNARARDAYASNVSGAY